MADISSEKVTGLLGLADALRLGEPGAQSLGSFELLRLNHAVLGSLSAR